MARNAKLHKLPAELKTVDLSPRAIQSTKSRVDSTSAKQRALAGLDLVIEHRAIDLLSPYHRNARTHSNAQISQIAASIREFGWTNPVLVDGESGVVAGHGRLLAARQLGLKTVPVIELAGLSEAARRAYVLADNKLALNAGWNEEMLAVEVSDLVGLGMDLGSSGFEAFEVEKLLNLFRQGAASSFPDEAPSPPDDPVTRPGDLWLLGKHRLLCGDATLSADVERVLGGARANMIFTDPPYNVAYEAKGDAKRRIVNDALGAAFQSFLENACRCMLRHCDGAVYICMSCAEIATLKSAFKAADGHWSTFIIWAKSNFTLGRSDYQRQFEPILYGWRKGADRYWCGARDQGDVWEFPKPARNDLHPTMKPLALVERAVRNSSKPDNLILDPFAGSGTTLMAAEACGRRAALIELAPAYCDVIIQRYEQAVSDRVIHQDLKKDFESVRKARVDSTC